MHTIARKRLNRADCDGRQNSDEDGLEGHCEFVMFICSGKQRLLVRGIQRRVE